MYKGIETKQKSFSSVVQKSVLFRSQQEIEWVVLWEALIRPSRESSQNIVIILLVFPTVRMSLKDYQNL